MPIHGELDDISVKDRVEELLSQDERARNDDVYLIFLYWRTFQGLNLDPIEASTVLRHTETIRRCRQSIQEEGLYPPTDPEVIEKRSRLD